ncbi:MAG: hypothetical protein BWK80_40640, partial [Desulfobacteraceae bacterium IS3]
MPSNNMSKADFINDRNVIVYEHLVVEDKVLAIIANHLANPHNLQAGQEMDAKLASLIKEVENKYDKPDLKEQIKLIYLFLMEGTKGAVTGTLREGRQEQKIKDAFDRHTWHSGFPKVKVLGIEELGEILARIEAKPNFNLKHQDFLLGENGKWGYDTPKIASAFIQLARRKYERQEMFIRLDNDVDPHGEGIKCLKDVYYDLITDSKNRQFCFSWNYFSEPITQTDPVTGPDYDKLFNHFVNAYSIRVSFFGDPSCSCQYGHDLMTGKLFCTDKANENDPCNTPCRLNIIHTKFFIDLFQTGKWGSNLKDPISGAGLCFSADSLKTIPPWCNTDEMISWIDDMAKFELMKICYGSDFEDKKALLSDHYIKGFPQNRHPKPFDHGNVKWAVNVYADRLLMGCIFAFALNPAKYDPSQRQGYAHVLREKEYGAALEQWTRIREGLFNAAQNHIRMVLQDWYYYFCEKLNLSPPGYIPSAQIPHGFVPVPANHFFNAYVIKQLLLLKHGEFKLTERVFKVFDRYLKLKYIFWPHVAKAVDEDVEAYQRAKKLGAASLDTFVNLGTGWMYLELPSATPVDRKPGRNSNASVAIIKRPNQQADAKAQEDQWLVQWNQKWKVMNLISGHIEGIDSSPLSCVMREIHEELFGILSADEYSRLKAAIGAGSDYDNAASSWKDPHIESAKLRGNSPYEYPEFSDSANKWTKYEFHIYDVEFKPGAKIFHEDLFYTPSVRQSPRAPNEWISLEDIGKGWTKMGRP